MTITQEQQTALTRYLEKYPGAAVESIAGPFEDWQTGRQYFHVYDAERTTSFVMFYTETDRDEEDFLGLVTVNGTRRGVHVRLVEGYSNVDHLFDIIEAGIREFLEDADPFKTTKAAEKAIRGAALEAWRARRREFAPSFTVEITGK